ncbi:putative F-box-like domain superfamily protein [Helianthus anomalus]
MVSFPFDILLFGILLRLNARSIDRCKCACREWRHGLSLWVFVWLHLTMLKVIWKLYGRIARRCIK